MEDDLDNHIDTSNGTANNETPPQWPINTRPANSAANPPIDTRDDIPETMTGQASWSMLTFPPDSRPPPPRVRPALQAQEDGPARVRWLKMR